jgi:hypothetical protein
MDYKTIIPDPSRLIEGLRDTGYSFNTAIADIVDNSIMASATNVFIEIELDLEGEIHLRIIDNGLGMDEEALMDAMKYGSKPKTDAQSLSKFGLGLKTGSTAFCRRLSVISRNNGNAELLKATWDLDIVASKHNWIVEVSEPSDEETALIDRITNNGSGTLVKWEKVDRLLKRYSNPAGKDAKKALSKHIESLKSHLSMVFQRFLNPSDQRARNVSITVNSTRLEHWDPFCEHLPESKIVGEKDVKVELNGNTSNFKIRTFIIPRKEEISDETELRKADITTNNQGIYVYRENRLICGPDWLGLYSKEPHANLMRVEFSFTYELDDAFHIDIKKSKITLNSELYYWLEEFLTPQRRAADERYRKGIQQIVKEAGKDAHDSSNVGIASKIPAAQSTITEEVDKVRGEIKLTNKQGTFVIKMPVSEPVKEGQFVIKPVDGIDDGLLWRPCIITEDGNTHSGVEINTNHPYYHKVYTPNLNSGVTVQGLDSLLWALCEAERSVVSPDISRQLRTLRYEVSRILRLLVEDMPDPGIEEL